MESYIERKRTYREIMAQTFDECREKIEKAREHFNQQPCISLFHEDQAKLSEKFQAESINQQIKAILPLLKERKIIDEYVSMDIVEWADMNLTRKYSTSSTYIIVNVLLVRRIKIFNEAINILAENGFDFNPGPMLKMHTARLLKRQDAPIMESLYRNLDDASRYIRYYKSYPVISLIVNRKQKYVMKSFLCLINNGLTDFGLSPTLDYIDFIYHYVSYIDKHKKNPEPEALMGIFCIMFDFGLQHGNGMKHYKHKMDLSRYSEFQVGFGKGKAMRNIIDYVEERKKQPMSLQKQTRLTIRRSVGGIQFQVKVRSLPLPPSLKNFVIGF